MPKIVLTAQVEDADTWEDDFRSHRDLFADFGYTDLYEFGIGENSEIAIVVDVDDPDDFLAALSSPENIAAMENDRVLRDTVKVWVLDKELQI